MISNKYKLVVLGPKELCMKPQMLKKCKKKNNTLDIHTILVKVKRKGERE